MAESCFVLLFVCRLGWLVKRYYGRGVAAPRLKIAWALWVIGDTYAVLIAVAALSLVTCHPGYGQYFDIYFTILTPLF